MYPRIQIRLAESLHNSDFILVTLTVADAKKVGKWQSVGLFTWPIRRVNTATNIHDVFRRYSCPIDNLLPRELGNRKDHGCTMTSPPHDGGIVEADGRVAILGTVNVTQIMDREDKWGPA